ncbi:hypothetical protein BC833DRAFT_564333 [Globomyces pollinis-pini]|nr:hypothetical protein BC833DRAFT_564333 [Globomyces pollinis-pini]
MQKTSHSEAMNKSVHNLTAPRVRTGCKACQSRREAASIERERDGHQRKQRSISNATIDRLATPKRQNSVSQLNLSTSKIPTGDAVSRYPRSSSNQSCNHSTMSLDESNVSISDQEISSDVKSVVEVVKETKLEPDIVKQLQLQLDTNTVNDLNLSPNSSTTISSAPFDKAAHAELVQRKRIYRQRNLMVMRDLGGLTQLLSAKNDELLSIHKLLSHVSESDDKEYMNEPRDIRLTRLKLDYISTARDIYDISSNIVISWHPVALRCTDKTLSKSLQDSLSKVEVLNTQFRSVTNRNENCKEDFDESKQLIACSHNVVVAGLGALRDLEAAQVRLDEIEA